MNLVYSFGLPENFTISIGGVCSVFAIASANRYVESLTATLTGAGLTKVD